VEEQQTSGWGDDIVGRIAQDLAADTGSARGFSRRNLFYMRRFATLWPEREKVPSVMAQITWTAHRVLMDRLLGPPDAQTLLEATKDPYVFDFLELTEDARERHLEQALIDDIQNFLIELGSGFAFYGRQRSLLVGDQEFFPDLLFFHHTLRRFVVIELKVGAFQPEYVGKMNFYLNAVDEQLRVGDDRESVGIILCTRGRRTTTMCGPSPLQ